MSTRTPSREACARFAGGLQDVITRRLEALDGQAFQEDRWERPGGGGGRSRVILDGSLFEKAGVNFSEVDGELPEDFAGRMPGEGRRFYATGISLVLHPWSPRVPTVHANFRYIEKGGHWWFGGGSDLTPYRLYAEDARHFHRVWKSACDRHDPSYYPRFKKWCDEYFHLPHRGEARGVGGIFFDDLTGDPERLLTFWKDAASSFLEAYVPIVERRRGEVSTADEREHQLLRRGRYVEFNLLHDRGTVFGLKTGGRTESILMSLPPLVRWGYDAGRAGAIDQPQTGPDAELLDVLKRPRDWLKEEDGGS
ncbi:MAG TPA: oxygen-dependent coproporphyrinogen oxidase [Planctomycetota bacterium]|nr:oxygen-dependent coproporphyrinogen oxidase [Planctomycetota bacterium]